MEVNQPIRNLTQVQTGQPKRTWRDGASSASTLGNLFLSNYKGDFTKHYILLICGIKCYSNFWPVFNRKDHWKCLFTKKSQYKLLQFKTWCMYWARVFLQTPYIWKVILHIAIQEIMRTSFYMKGLFSCGFNVQKVDKPNTAPVLNINKNLFGCLKYKQILTNFTIFNDVDPKITSNEYNFIFNIP